MGVQVNRLGDLDGQPIDEASLTSDDGVSVKIMSWGAAVRDWLVPVASTDRSVVLGFDSFAPYPDHSPYFGAIVGRVANRIGNATFGLNGTQHKLEPNEGENQLHGGPKGLSRCVWALEPDKSANSVRFSYTSPAGEMGYPGTLACEVIYTLRGNRLRLQFRAVPDEPSPVNLVQHIYFNLGTGPDVLDHKVHLPSAVARTVLDGQLIPTGEIVPVKNTPYDFLRPRTMRDSKGAPADFDLNYVLATGRNFVDPIADIVSAENDMRLQLFSDQPGLQFYDGVMTDVSVPGRADRIYGKYSGFCVEDQKWPDAVNHPHFPQIICTPERPYTHWCEIDVSAIA